MKKFPDSIAEAKDEQRTFEVLKMGQEEFNELSYIRRQMRYIIAEENAHAESQKED